jgi:alpha-L-rhamnosidase|tara:strand:+ start:1918 stop:4611 length:2694 start_codon:yes stop_codon:yes gene_type:complete
MSNDLFVTRPRCEYEINPIGIDVRNPRLGWQLVSARRETLQSAYRILVADSLVKIEQDIGNLWDSQRVSSDRSNQIEYAGSDLPTRQRCYWKVMVWDTREDHSSWSEVAYWEMGLLDSSEWQADWITADIPEDKAVMSPSPMFRAEFEVGDNVQSARIYATALGTYELHLDGHRVGDAYFTPGWTSYSQRLQYQTYDVTDQLTSGRHALGAIVADGWYRGNLANFRGDGRCTYGDTLALYVQLVIDYEGGATEIISSNPDWRAETGPILYTDHYMGEKYDAQLERPGWTEVDYDDSWWAGARLVDPPEATIVAQTGPLVRKMHEVVPTEILTTPDGTTVVDFGQNMVGWIRLVVAGAAGTVVTLRHAEVLDGEGNLYTANLRPAKQTVTYILRGAETEQYEPRFTFQGFRYVAVDGYPGTLNLDSLTGIVVYSAMTATGSFECSNPLVNRLQQNIVWGQRGNFLDVPTDCPQRDERLGWTGDAQVFTRTACFNMDVAAFFTRWLRDLVCDQRADGAYPHVAPNVLGKGAAGATGWADAGVICPWTLYLCYGDTRILAEHYGPMQRWIDYMVERAGDDLIWRGDFHFGDWLSTERDDLGRPFGVTENDLMATAFFAFSSSLMIKIAALLDDQESMQRYEELLIGIRRAFCREFVTPAGRIGTNTQTAYVVALMFDLLPEGTRSEAARRLVANIRDRGNHLSTGFLGTPYLCHVLTRFGHLDVAYDLLLQDSCPSWLYPVTRGATTIWERWDGIKPDGSFQNVGMNSFNHYAYGAIGHWLYSVVAGLELDEASPGYRHTIIRPQPGGKLFHAKAGLETPYGRLSSRWEIDDTAFRLDVTVPPNTTATVILGAVSIDDVTEGKRPLSAVEGIISSDSDGQTVSIEVGSGEYEFRHSVSRE